jgi:hypothetical protein
VVPIISPKPIPRVIAKRKPMLNEIKLAFICGKTIPQVFLRDTIVK